MIYSSVCLPWWYNDTKSTCPYGRCLPGDVTLPNRLGPMEAIAVFYSILPYLIVALNILELLIRRGTRQMSFRFFTALITLTNEFLMKQIIVQPRPGARMSLTNEVGEEVGSCILTCGMPSTHATMAVGFVILLICDGVYRVVPSRAQLTIGVRREPFSARECMQFFTCTPLAPKPVMTHREFAWFFLSWAAVFMPLPLMRARLYDHSLDQVIVGSGLGVLYAGLWFWLTHWFTRKFSSHVGENFCRGIFTHDYRPAEFRVKIRDQTILAGAVIVAATDQDVRGSLELRSFSGIEIVMQH